MDTIFAPATALCRAGVSVIRVSGTETQKVISALCTKVPENGRALRLLKDAQGRVIDQALVLHFAPGKSFTGEETVEFHVHGSLIVQKKLLSELSAMKGLRSAEAGEFTRRAFENGRLDLSQVEGLSDLIDAETEMQHLQAMRNFDGELRQKADAWRNSMLSIEALFTASLDFSDEDIPEYILDQACSMIDKLINDLTSQVEGSRAAQEIREGFEIAIIGRPNTGKSTLLNRLAGRDVAIVSEYAGTTRDVVEVKMNIAGFSVRLMDTAGIRETDDPVEKIGIDRAIERSENSDLRIVLYDPTYPIDLPKKMNDILIGAKSDLTGFGVSGKTGHGIDELLLKIENMLQLRTQGSSLLTNERQKRAIETSLEYLSSSLYALIQGQDAVLASEMLRAASRSMQSLTGLLGVEDVLDVVFSKFCVGK